MEPSSVEIRPVDTVAPSHGVTAVFHCLTENVPWETLWNCFCNCKRDKGQTTLASAGPRENGRLADKSTHSSEVQPYVMNAIQSSTRARSWSTSIGMNSNSFPIVRRGKGCPPVKTPSNQTRPTPSRLFVWASYATLSNKQTLFIMGGTSASGAQLNKVTSIVRAMAERSGMVKGTVDMRTPSVWPRPRPCVHLSRRPPRVCRSPFHL